MHKKIKLYSKRNDVFRIMDTELDGEKTYIEKRFKNKENYIREKEVLGILKNAHVNVPSIVKAQDNTLHLEDLQGSTFLYWYEKWEKENTIDLDMVYELCRWLKSFYKLVGEFYKEETVLYDVNFNNFILVDGNIYGIDFEQVQKGNISQDAGKLLAYGLTYNPAMTEWKINFRNIFIDILSKELNIDKEKINKEEKIELEAIKERRKNK